MESTSELAWFRSEVLRSIVQPRSFARSLAREHFGLAGVLIVVAAGTTPSPPSDRVGPAAKSMPPPEFSSPPAAGATLPRAAPAGGRPGPGVALLPRAPG